MCLDPKARSLIWGLALEIPAKVTFSLENYDYNGKMNENKKYIIT